MCSKEMVTRGIIVNRQKPQFESDTCVFRKVTVLAQPRDLDKGSRNGSVEQRVYKRQARRKNQRDLILFRFIVA